MHERDLGRLCIFAPAVPKHVGTGNGDELRRMRPCVQVCAVADGLKPHAGSFHMGYRTSASWDLQGGSKGRQSGTGAAVPAADNENRSAANNCGEASTQPGHDRGKGAEAQAVEVRQNKVTPVALIATPPDAV